MKTFAKIAVITVAAASFVLPAHAASLPELVAEITTKQISEVSASIKEQAKNALESTVKELFAQDKSQKTQTQLVANTTVSSNQTNE